MELKKCKNCGELKPLVDYYKANSCKDGLNSNCIVCIKIKQATYRSKNKRNCKGDILKEKALKYYYGNRNECLIKMKEYRDNNKDKVKKIKKEYRDNNKDKVKEYSRDYFLKNRESVLAKNRAWNKNNKHIVTWRSILKSHLKRLGKPKEGKTIDVLGYSALELKEHLEKLFTEGMSWDNHGEWHVDHKIPISSFSSDTSPAVVNALSNLQPLWATTREINGVIYEGNLNKYNYE